MQKAHLAITDLTITAERESGADFTMPFMNLGELSSVRNLLFVTITNVMNIRFRRRHCSFILKTDKRTAANFFFPITFLEVCMGFSCCRLFYRITVFIHFGSPVSI